MEWVLGSLTICIKRRIMHNIVSTAYQATRAHEAAWMAIPFVCIRDYDAKLLSSVLGQAETAKYLVQPIQALKKDGAQPHR